MLLRAVPLLLPVPASGRFPRPHLFTTPRTALPLPSAPRAPLLLLLRRYQDQIPDGFYEVHGDFPEVCGHADFPHLVPLVKARSLPGRSRRLPPLPPPRACATPTAPGGQANGCSCWAWARRRFRAALAAHGKSLWLSPMPAARSLPTAGGAQAGARCRHTAEGGGAC